MEEKILLKLSEEAIDKKAEERYPTRVGQYETEYSDGCRTGFAEGAPNGLESKFLQC